MGASREFIKDMVARLNDDYAEAVVAQLDEYNAGGLSRHLGPEGRAELVSRISELSRRGQYMEVYRRRGLGEDFDLSTRAGAEEFSRASQTMLASMRQFDDPGGPDYLPPTPLGQHFGQRVACANALGVALSAEGEVGDGSHEAFLGSFDGAVVDNDHLGVFEFREDGSLRIDEAVRAGNDAYADDVVSAWEYSGEFVDPQGLRDLVSEASLNGVYVEGVAEALGEMPEDEIFEELEAMNASAAEAHRGRIFVSPRRGDGESPAARQEVLERMGLADVAGADQSLEASEFWRQGTVGMEVRPTGLTLPTLDNPGPVAGTTAPAVRVEEREHVADAKTSRLRDTVAKGRELADKAAVVGAKAQKVARQMHAQSKMYETLPGESNVDRIMRSINQSQRQYVDRAGDGPELG